MPEYKIRLVNERGQRRLTPSWFCARANGWTPCRPELGHVHRDPGDALACWEQALEALMGDPRWEASGD